MLLDFIRKKYHRHVLHRLQEQQRDKCIHNWKDIKTIGLIFTVGDRDFWNLIQRFISAQESNGKEVHLIGFQENGHDINYIFSHTLTTICHEKEDFNMMQLPKTDVVNNFLDHHFDLLIDASNPDHFFGRYITTATEADLKVGYFDQEDEENSEPLAIYDMNIEGNGPVDFKDYIEQIVKYLSMIQK